MRDHNNNLVCLNCAGITVEKARHAEWCEIQRMCCHCCSPGSSAWAFERILMSSPICPRLLVFRLLALSDSSCRRLLLAVATLAARIMRHLSGFPLLPRLGQTETIHDTFQRKNVAATYTSACISGSSHLISGNHPLPFRDSFWLPFWLFRLYSGYPRGRI